MTGKLSKNFHGVGIGPLSKILAVNMPSKLYSMQGMKINKIFCKNTGVKK